MIYSPIGGILSAYGRADGFLERLLFVMLFSFFIPFATLSSQITQKNHILELTADVIINKEIEEKHFLSDFFKEAGVNRMKFPNDEMNIFVRKHNADGSTAVVPCTMSVLTPEDGEDSVRLHDEVAHGLSREIFAASPKAEVHRFLSDEGLGVGIKHNGALISLRTVRTGESWVREFIVQTGLPPEEASGAAVTGFCVVDRAFRGNNVQFLSQYYTESLLSRCFNSVYTTVSPMNIFSLDNVLNCNYRIIAIKEVYGGCLRYVLRKEFYPEFPLWTRWHLQIPIRELEAQRAALASGHVGYKMVRKLSGIHILYAKAGAEPEAARPRSNRPPMRLL